MSVNSARRPPTRRALPPLAPARPMRRPPMTDTTLVSGLRVVAVRAPSVAMVEVRLQLPIGPVLDRPGADAGLAVLADTVTRQTARRTRDEVVTVLGEAGAGLTASVAGRWLAVVGSTPAAALPAVLRLLAEFLISPGYHDGDTARARERIARQLVVMRAQPIVIAQEALRTYCFESGAPPVLPDVRDVGGVTAEALTDLHAAAVRPTGGHLVLVGDLDPDDAVAAVAEVMADWEPVGGREPAPPRPAVVLRPERPVVPVARPGAAQAQVVLVAPAPATTHDDFPALALGNCAVGGYFSARLVATIREEAGLAYRVDAHTVDIGADRFIQVWLDTDRGSATPALAAVRAELHRACADPPSAVEIDAARQFMTGTVLIDLSSQAGMAGQFAAALSHGRGPDWLFTLIVRLGGVSTAEVAAIVRRYFAPDLFAGVVVGSAD